MVRDSRPSVGLQHNSRFFSIREDDRQIAKDLWEAAFDSEKALSMEFRKSCRSICERCLIGDFQNF